MPNIAQMSKEIRYYQKNAITAIDSALARGVTRQLLVMATGSGKTFTAVKAIEGKGRVLWGTHTEELVEQSSIALLAEKQLMAYHDLLYMIDSHGGIIDLLKNSKKGGFFNDPKTELIASQIGIVKAELFDINKPIVVASMQTLHNRLDKIPYDHFNIFVLDEAHYSGANTWIKSMDYFKVNLRLGLTATPHRMDGVLMGDIFDEIVYEYDIAQGIKDKYLCKIDAIRIATNVDIDKVHTSKGDLNEKELEQAINTPVRNGLIVRKYKQYSEGRQFIASCANVQHAMDLCEAFRDEGVKCNFIVGDKELTTDRKGLIYDFKAGVETGLCHVMVLTAGFDHSEVACMIQASPTKSLTKYLQQIGRGTRLKFGQFKDLIVLDFVDSTKRHKLINCWELDKTKPPEDRIFISDEKREQLLLARQAAVSNTPKLDENTQKKDEKVNLLELPKFEVNKSIRMTEEATQGQLDWIKDEGYDIVNNKYTKGQCAMIISSFECTRADFNLLKDNGYDVSGGVTRGEAEEAKKQIAKKKLQSSIKGATNLNIEL